MKNSPEIKAFIRAHSALFWYTPDDKKEEISKELLVEMILNYGDLDAILKLIELMGIKNVSRVFFNADGRKKLNYFPEIHHFFSLFFTRYA